MIQGQKYYIKEYNDHTIHFVSNNNMYNYHFLQCIFLKIIIQDIIVKSNIILLTKFKIYIITDIRNKENDFDGIYFNIIALFGRCDLMNKIWERPPGRLPKNKQTNAATLKWAKLCTGSRS